MTMVFKEVKLLLSSEEFNDFLNEKVNEVDKEFKKRYSKVFLLALLVIAVANVSVILFNNIDMVIGCAFMYLLFIIVNWSKMNPLDYLEFRDTKNTTNFNVENPLEEKQEILKLNEVVNGNKTLELISLLQYTKNKVVGIKDNFVIVRDETFQLDWRLKVDTFVSNPEVICPKLFVTKDKLIVQIPEHYVVSSRDTYSFEDDKMIQYRSIRKVVASEERFDDSLFYCKFIQEDVIKEEINA